MVVAQADFGSNHHPAQSSCSCVRTTRPAATPAVPRQQISARAEGLADSTRCPAGGTDPVEMNDDLELFEGVHDMLASTRSSSRPGGPRRGGSHCTRGLSSRTQGRFAATTNHHRWARTTPHRAAQDQLCRTSERSPLSELPKARSSADAQYLETRRQSSDIAMTRTPGQPFADLRERCVDIREPPRVPVPGPSSVRRDVRAPRG